MRYRKKPVVIEAMRIFAYTEIHEPAAWNDHRGGDVWRWMDDNGGAIHLTQDNNGPAYGIIYTLEGPMRAAIGDWIIKGVQGEFYPCKPDIFDATYEPVDVGEEE